MLHTNYQVLRHFIIPILVFCHLTSFAGSTDALHVARQHLDERNEVYFSFEKPNKEVLRQLFNIVSIQRIDVGQVLAYANSEEFKLFSEFGLAYEVLPPPSYVDFNLNMLDWDELRHRDLTGSWDFYPTYEAYLALMYQFEEDYPGLVEIINIGETVMGRDLLFARISPQLDEARPVPQFMYTATMHGNETAGFVLSLRLIHHLITNYGQDDSITNLMNSVDIFICPNENPDGTYTHDNSTVLGATRTNANGVDLNRNYPNPVSDPLQAQQPETTAMINFADSINFIMSANMHGGIELVNFPFDSWTSSQNTHADHEWWEFVMYEYVDTVHAYSPPGYMTGLGNGVTNGGDWFVSYGSRQDYFNYYRSCREFTLELSNQMLLNPELLPAHWEYNYPSLLNYIRQSTYGVHGLVYDNQTGEPVHAEIYIPEHDSNNSEVFTSIPSGNYNRPLVNGAYNMQYSVEGYVPVTIDGVEVDNYQTTWLNVAMGEGVGGQLIETTIAAEGEGSVFPFTGTQYFNEGANVFLEAATVEEWVFMQWELNGDFYSYETETVIPISDSDNILAVFSQGASLPGDANLDGEVNMLDVISIINYYLELNPAPFCFQNADVNQDGTINILDAIGTVTIFLDN